MVSLSNIASPRITFDAELMSGWGGGFVLGVGGVESSFVTQLSPGPLGYTPRDLAALLVAINYFTQLEVYLSQHLLLGLFSVS